MKMHFVGLHYTIILQCMVQETLKKDFDQADAKNRVGILTNYCWTVVYNAICSDDNYISVNNYDPQGL
jgi:hypothetical protein